jgi:hypothetical protein
MSFATGFTIAAIVAVVITLVTVKDVMSGN